MFSDGAIEQKGADGEPFGLGRLVEISAAASGAMGDVTGICEALERYSPTGVMSDDLTVASVEWLRATADEAGGS